MVGSRGAIVMAFFGAVFLSLTLAWERHIIGPIILVPFLGFALIAAAAIYTQHTGRRNHLSDHAKRTLIWASIAEGVGIFIALNIVINLHRPDWQLPAMALVVGLHFLPIARAAGHPALYVLGGAMIAVAIAGFIVPGSIGGQLAGIAAGLSLWIASIEAIRRDWQLTPTDAMPA